MYVCSVVKSRVVPLTGEIVAPGVKVNSGARQVMSASLFTVNVTDSLSISGSDFRTSPATVHVNISASALGASSLMQAVDRIIHKKQANKHCIFIVSFIRVKQLAIS